MAVVKAKADTKPSPGKVFVTIALTSPTIAKIDQIAAEERRSRTNLVEVLLLEAVRAYRTPASRLSGGEENA